MKNHIINWGITATAGIVAIIVAGWIVGWRNFWFYFLDLILRGWGFLFSDQTLVFDGWVILVFGVLILFGLLSVIFICVINIQNKNKPKPKTYRKREGIVNNIKWRWEQHEDQVSNLRGFCPKCDLELEFPKLNLYETIVYCERCGIDFPDLPANYSGAIIREIQRQYRAKQNSL